jgi:RNA polymerase sigma-70 factor (ECF subfamily)
MRNEATAADLVQDTWLAVVNGIRRFRVGARFEPWLFGIANHKLNDYLRRLYPKIGGQGSDDEVIDVRPAPNPASGPPVDTDLVKVILDRLPAPCKQFLVLHYIEGLSYDEIRARLGLDSIGTVSSRVSRCLKSAQEIEKSLRYNDKKASLSV